MGHFTSITNNYLSRQLLQDIGTTRAHIPILDHQLILAPVQESAAHNGTHVCWWPSISNNVPPTHPLPPPACLLLLPCRQQWCLHLQSHTLTTMPPAVRAKTGSTLSAIQHYSERYVPVQDCHNSAKKTCQIYQKLTRSAWNRRFSRGGGHTSRHML